MNELRRRHERAIELLEKSQIAMKSARPIIDSDIGDCARFAPTLLAAMRMNWDELLGK